MISAYTKEIRAVVIISLLKLLLLILLVCEKLFKQNETCQQFH